MKKLLSIIASVLFFTITSIAQEKAATAGAESKPKLTQEEKAKMKEKQEAELMAAFKEAGLTEDEIKQAKQIMADAGTKNNEIKKDVSLSDDAKKEKIKAVNDEKNNKLKELMGKDRYKVYNDARKKQKEATATEKQ